MAEAAKYVLVGGGVASVCAAQAIRERDPEGRILIVRDEVHVPYDRPPLSKGMLKSNEMGLDDCSSKYESFYTDNKIDRMLGKRAVSLDRATKTLTLDDGSTVTYEKLLLATGSRASKPDIPGVDLPGVYSLRTLEDSEALRDAIAKAQRVLIVGSGYIAFEVASVCVLKGIETRIVSQDRWPWENFASEGTGHFVAESFRNADVTVSMNTEIESIEPGPVVNAVDGRQFKADAVVLGTGIRLNTELAEAAGLAVDPEHGIACNQNLQTEDPDIYVAGDVTYFPDRPLGLSGEHHLNAKWQGAAAGANMAGANEAYARVPYFWSDFLDLHMILRGHPERARPVRVLGDRNAGEFVEIYENFDGEIVMGIAFSKDEPKLDGISDKLEEAIGSRTEEFALPE